MDLKFLSRKCSRHITLFFTFSKLEKLGINLEVSNDRLFQMPRNYVNQFHDAESLKPYRPFSVNLQPSLHPALSLAWILVRMEKTTNH